MELPAPSYLASVTKNVSAVAVTRKQPWKISEAARGSPSSDAVGFGPSVGLSSLSASGVLVLGPTDLCRIEGEVHWTLA